MAKLTKRRFELLRDRLKFLDEEITRYRDFEWKATSFHAAFFVAVAYLLLDPVKKAVLVHFALELTGITVVYASQACAQLLYIHHRLNARRNDRSDLLALLGEESSPKNKGLRGFYEGVGFLFVACFVTCLAYLAFIVIRILWFEQQNTAGVQAILGN